MRNIIVAYDLKRGIGAQNELLWGRTGLKGDLRRMKEITMGESLIMGRRTYESIGRPLPGRQNIVISRSMPQTEGIEVVPTLKAAYDAVKHEHSFIFGGARVYRESLDFTECIYVTEVQAIFPEAEVFFPLIDMNEWQEVSRQHHDADEQNKYSYDFVRYIKQR